MPLFLQPAVKILGHPISEPVTSLTGLLVAVVSVHAWVKLRQMEGESVRHRWHRFFFLMMGLGMLVSGLFGHAFLHLFSHAYKLPGWLFCMLSITAFEQAAIENLRGIMRDERIRRFLLLSWLLFCFFSVLAIQQVRFIWVEVQAALGLVVVAGYSHGVVYRIDRNRGSLLMLLGIGVAVLAVLPHVFKIGFGVWFNHFDIGHVLIAVSMWLFGCGSVEIHASDASVVQARGVGI
jgi:hypothetical protein